MFKLTRTGARLTSYNARSETHGTDQVPAGDMRFEVKTDNTVLSHFGRMLRAALYSKASSPEAPLSDQGELNVDAPVSDMPHLTCPGIVMPIKIQFEGVGYRLHVDYGLGESSSINLDECKVADVTADCQEGGAVVLRFRVSRSDMPERARGILSGAVKRDLMISLTPPDADQMEIKE